mmetsp:Transcript_26746/g.49111  ORF Transcript_26746/g.49111 Transcript_26746/m.49111 type:complete len:80 (+) Transcript_26746:1270-1509(+)
MLGHRHTLGKVKSRLVENVRPRAFLTGLSSFNPGRMPEEAVAGTTACGAPSAASLALTAAPSGDICCPSCLDFADYFGF